MNEKINKALQKIQFELGPYTESHYENIFKNVKMYVVDGDATRDISFNVIVDETHCILRINTSGVQFDSLPLGYTLMVNEEATVELLFVIAENINKNCYGKEMVFSNDLINTIFVCEKTPKLYTELELDTQIRQHVEKELSEFQRVQSFKYDELEQEHEAHLNAVLADVYTDIFYGVKRKRCDNKLQSLKQKNLSSKRKIKNNTKPLHMFLKGYDHLKQKLNDNWMGVIDKEISNEEG